MRSAHPQGAAHARRAGRCSATRSPPRGALDPQRLAVVVRHERDRVAAHAPRARRPDALVADQDDMPGTGPRGAVRAERAGRRAHAARVADGGREGRPARRTTVVDGPVVVIAGDIPLLDGGDPRPAARGARRRRQRRDRAHHRRRGPDRLRADRCASPARARSLGIVEQKDADRRAARDRARSTPRSTCSTPRCCAGRSGRLGRDNAQGEVYLTDVARDRPGRRRRGARGPGRRPVPRRGRQRPGAARARSRAELNRRAARGLDARRRHRRRPRDHVGRRRRRARAGRHPAARDPAARATTVAARRHRRPGHHADATSTVGAGAQVVRTHGSGSRDRRRAPSSARSPTCGPARDLGERGQDRRVRRDQERHDRRPLEGAAPVLRRRRDDRRAHEHRCGDHLRQLRRRHQAPHDRRLPRAHRLGQRARRAGDHRRRRLHRRRLGDPPRRAARRAGREHRAAAHHRGLGAAPPCRHPVRARPRHRAALGRATTPRRLVTAGRSASTRCARGPRRPETSTTEGQRAR